MWRTPLYYHVICACRVDREGRARKLEPKHHALWIGNQFAEDPCRLSSRGHFSIPNDSLDGANHISKIEEPRLIPCVTVVIGQTGQSLGDEMYIVITLVVALQKLNEKFGLIQLLLACIVIKCRLLALFIGKDAAYGQGALIFENIEEVYQVLFLFIFFSNIVLRIMNEAFPRAVLPIMEELKEIQQLFGNIEILAFPKRAQIIFI